jgi:hypothetical protein
MEKTTRQKEFILKEVYRLKRLENKFIYVSDLKHTCKTNGIDIKGCKKKQLIELLDHCYGYEVLDLRGPNINSLDELTNNEDFFSFDKLESIDKELLFIIEETKFTYGFDIRSFKKLIETTNKNPYTMTDFTGEIKDRYKKRVEQLKNKKISLDYEPETQMTPEQEFYQRVLKVFIKMDELNVVASGTNPNWFLELSLNQLKKMYRVLEDIWNFRSNMTNEQRNKIVPGNNIFRYPLFWFLNIDEKEKIQLLLLNEMDKLVSSASNINDKITGCYYILIALTEICPNIANELPWLIQY